MTSASPASLASAAGGGPRPERTIRAPLRRAAVAAAVAFTAACVLVTATFFGRAYSMVDAGLAVTRAEAIERARALAAAEGLAPAGARVAARFETNDTLATYVDLAAGGPDSLRALVAGSARSVPMYTWAVRLFEPGSPREALVRFAPDGRVVGVERTLAQDDRRLTITEAAGRLAADGALARWTARRVEDYRFVSASYVTQSRSGRVDRTYVYERGAADGRPARVGDAPVRLFVAVTGDSARPVAVPLAVAERAEIPEAFERRYAEMQSANDLFASLSLPGTALFFLVAVVGVLRLRARGQLRPRPALAVGALVGVFIVAAGLNAIPGSWFDYDTATPPAVFVATGVLTAVLGGAGAGVFVASTVAAAEGLTRRAFPEHHDWFAFWRYRGSPAIAARVLGGYVLAAFGFAYVTLFYVATRGALGWWVPAGTLDDPNQIATPLPWVPAVGLSLFAGIWEEAIFRAVPLAGLALWARGRRGGGRWMALGVLATALVFGFGHANYPSWPPYSRGVELLLEAALWAALYLRVGLPTTIVGHVLYDLGWFGLFALHGDGAEYRATAGLVLLAFFFPALAVGQGWVAGRLARRRAARVTLGTSHTLGASAAAAPAPPRFGDWSPPADEPAAPERAGPGRAAVPFTRRRRAAALAVAGAGALALAAWPPRAPLGPTFTAPEARVRAAADSALQARGADPAGWRRLAATREAPNGAARRFLAEALGARDALARARALSATYLPTAWWEVRYVRTAGAVADRAEEWRVRVLPNGQALDARRLVPEGRPGASPTPDSARALVAPLLAGAGVARAGLREVELRQTPRPRRLDTRAEYEDAGTPLPGGASARVRASLAGAEPLGVTRGLELPEGFARAERERASARQLQGAVGGVGALGLAVALLVAAARRPDYADTRPLLGRRGVVALGAAAALAALAPRVNALPALAAEWPTVVPWTTFLAQSALTTLLGVAAVGAMTAALWALADALRRRAGVPFWPQDTAGVRDALAGGTALGVGASAVGLVIARARPGGWPAPPDTALDRLVPALDGVFGVLGGALLQPAVAIVPLAFALGARGRGRRVLALLLGVVLLAPVTRGEGGLIEAGAALGAQAVLLTLLVRAFGAQSGLAWVFAALATAAVGGVRDARAAANGTDVTSALLGAVTAASIAAVAYRAAIRRDRGSAQAGTHARS